MGSVVSQEELLAVRIRLKSEKKRVVFTNGCFDILHRGHVEYLERARTLGDNLIVGLNTDTSARRLKGAGRPINPQQDRAVVLAALRSVDYVALFDEDTPYELIKKIVPDILVKGADWSVDDVVGKDVVLEAGGSVQTIEFLPDRSTTRIIERIQATSETG